MQYPYLEINLDKIYENTSRIVNKAKDKDIDITAVTKCVAGNKAVAETFVEAGVCALGDSRISNLKILKDLKIPKWLLRIPMLSEVDDVIKYSDISLNSEIQVIKALDKAAKLQKTKHKVLLMIDIGDLREGWFDLDSFYKEMDSIADLKNIEIAGIGTNTNCAGAVIPEPKTFKNFPKIIEFLENRFGLKDLIVSGGNSGSYYMLENGSLPGFINNLRLGELLLFGRESSYFENYKFLNQDAFNLKCEIVELKNKPSMPIGKLGKDAFGLLPHFEDKGIRKRAILAIGKQDMNPEDLFPEDKDIQIITSSSDHLIVDLTDSKKEYNIGDIISFRCNYLSALRTSTSDYVSTYAKSNL